MTNALSALPGSILLGYFIFRFVIHPFWPWDWKGRRKHLTLNRRKNQW